MQDGDMGIEYIEIIYASFRISLNKTEPKQVCILNNSMREN